MDVVSASRRNSIVGMIELMTAQRRSSLDVSPAMLSSTVLEGQPQNVGSPKPSHVNQAPVAVGVVDKGGPALSPLFLDEHGAKQRPTIFNKVPASLNLNAGRRSSLRVNQSKPSCEVGSAETEIVKHWYASLKGLPVPEPLESQRPMGRKNSDARIPVSACYIEPNNPVVHFPLPVPITASGALSKYEFQPRQKYVKTLRGIYSDQAVDKVCSYPDTYSNNCHGTKIKSSTVRRASLLFGSKWLSQCTKKDPVLDYKHTQILNQQPAADDGSIMGVVRVRFAESDLVFIQKQSQTKFESADTSSEHSAWLA